MRIQYLQALQHDVTEVRILRKSSRGELNGKLSWTGKTVAGYYDVPHYQKLLEDITPYEKSKDTLAIYTTLHACVPELLSRYANRLEQQAKLTTSDHEMAFFSLFPVDVDPERPSGIASTRAELETARENVLQVDALFDALGIPYLRAMSGNGYHRLVLMERLAVTDESIEAFKGLGDIVASHFGTDTTIYNPSRIWKLYGTTTRKGDSTNERPHRTAKIEFPDEVQRIAFAELQEKLLAELKVEPSIDVPSSVPSSNPSPSRSTPDMTLKEWLDQWNIPYTEKAYKGGTKYQLDCPFDPSHTSPDAVCYEATGGWAFKCSHNSCASYAWQDFKAKVAPDTGKKKSPPKGESRDPEGHPTQPKPRSTDRPRIVLNHFVHTENGMQIEDRVRFEVSDDAVELLKKNPEFMRRGDRIGIIETSGEGSYGWIPAEKSHVTGNLSRIADFFKLFFGENKDGETVVKSKVIANPPAWVAEDILISQDLQDFAEIKLIIQHPIMWGGEIIDAPGLHKPSGFFRIPSTFVDLEYPDTPKDAIGVMRDILEDVPFATDADLENALAIPLTMIVRPSFPAGEMAPLFAINAASPGTGKSALAKILLIAMLGSLPAASALSEDKEELRKSVFTTLMEAKNYALFDNLDTKRPLDSGLLASLISEPTHTGRILGGNSSGTFANNMVSLYTGNNVQASAELVDRGILIQLESPAERSSERNFKHKEIFQHVLENRSKILGAFMHLVGNWIEKGCPQSEHRHRMGYWARTLGGIMETNKFGQHFLENMMQFRRQADAESPKWAQAFTAIYEQFGEEPFMISDIFSIVSYKKSYYDKSKHIPAEGENLLGGLYKDVPQSDPTRATRVGLLFKTRVGQTLNHLKLLEDGTYANRKRYRLKKVNKE